MDDTGASGQGEVARGPSHDAPEDDAHRGGPPGKPVTPSRFVGALVIACVLLFVMFIVMALAGLGSIGIAPALVAAVAFTSRITGIRRMSALVALGALSFVIVVVMTYAIAIAVLVAAGG